MRRAKETNLDCRFVSKEKKRQSGISYKMYCKDTRAVLKQHVAHTKSVEIIMPVSLLLILVILQALDLTRRLSKRQKCRLKLQTRIACCGRSGRHCSTSQLLCPYSLATNHRHRSLYGIQCPNRYT